MGGGGFEQMIHECGIDHAGFVDDDEIAFEGILSVAFESAGAEVVFEEAVDGGGFVAGDFGHAFGGASGGCREEYVWREFLGDCEDGFGDGAFSGSWAAGDDLQFCRLRPC